ncbi:3'(2'),5'-bisphosphate nucleotidase CysQ [bacterium]|nr:3'(2'),5'-bisphosphate nucleotidase CysQ [bacterium]
MSPHPATSSHPDIALCQAIGQLAVEAAEAVLAVYAGEFTVERKDDKSPVTEADTAAHHIIAAGLARLTPHIPVISEEETSNHAAAAADEFWLVDPLDGTKSFIKRTGEFTVNIGLIRNHQPALGVVQVPVTGKLYGGVVGMGAWLREKTGPERAIRTLAPSKDGLNVVMSQSHLDDDTRAFVAHLQVKSAIKAGSSLKFCAVADGSADIYPRFAPTMEWDTAAGHAVLNAAGGLVLTPEGKPFTYGKPDYRNGHFIAYGSRELLK